MYIYVNDLFFILVIFIVVISICVIDLQDKVEELEEENKKINNNLSMENDAIDKLYDEVFPDDY